MDPGLNSGFTQSVAGDPFTVSKNLIMSQVRRNSHVCASPGVEIKTYVDGDGPSFVILPSYGRDGGEISTT